MMSSSSPEMQQPEQQEQQASTNPQHEIFEQQQPLPQQPSSLLQSTTQHFDPLAHREMSLEDLAAILRPPRNNNNSNNHFGDGPIEEEGEAEEEIVILDEPPSPLPSLLARRKSKNAAAAQQLPPSLHVISSTTAAANTSTTATSQQQQQQQNAYNNSYTQPPPPPYTSQFLSQPPPYQTQPQPQQQKTFDYRYGNRHYRVNSSSSGSNAYLPGIPSIPSIHSLASIDDDDDDTALMTPTTSNNNNTDNDISPLNHHHPHHRHRHHSNITIINTAANNEDNNNNNNNSMKQQQQQQQYDEVPLTITDDISPTFTPLTHHHHHHHHHHHKHHTKHHTSEEEEEEEGHVMIRVQSESDIASENTRLHQQQQLEHLKDIMMIELHGDKIPLSSALVERKIVLPSESLKAREMAIETKVKLRDKRIERWKKAMERAKNGLSSSLSMENLVQFGKSENSLLQKLKSRLLSSGDSSGSSAAADHKRKVYDVRREDLDDVKGIIMDLGYALSMYGVPSHRLEYYCALIASFYGIMCTTFSVPTGLFFCFGNYDERDAGTYIIKITGSSLNLSKLCQLDDVAERIARGQCTIAYARRKIKEIIESRPLYNSFMINLLAGFLQSGLFSFFFNANLGEILASFIAGLAVGVLSLVAYKYEGISQVVGILCGVVAGIVGIAFKVILGSYYPVSVFIIALNGVISLLPGLTFTVSITELSARQLLSGSSRLMSAFVAVIQLGFGVMIADKMAHFVKSIDIFRTMPDPLVRAAYAPWVMALILPLLALTTIIQFKAPKYPLALIFIALDAYAGFFSNYFVTMVFGKEMGTIVGAFCVGLIANIYGLVCGHPSIVVSTCGILYLVPGSLGYRSVDAFLQRDSTRGLAFIFDMFITGISLTVGLLLADLFALKRKKLSL